MTGPPAARPLPSDPGGIQARADGQQVEVPVKDVVRKSGRGSRVDVQAIGMGRARDFAEPLITEDKLIRQSFD